MRFRSLAVKIPVLLYLSLFPSGFFLPVYAQSNSSVEDFLHGAVEHLNELLTRSASAPHQAVCRYLEEIIDLEVLTRQTFGNYLEKTLSSYGKIFDKGAQRELLVHYRRQLVDIFRQRLHADLSAYLDAAQLRQLSLKSTDYNGDEGQVELHAKTQDGSLAISLKLRHIEKVWRIVDLAFDGRYVSKRYRKLCHDILEKRYSLPVLAARLGYQDYIVLEDFSTTPPGQLPRDWGSWRPRDEKKPKLYQVQVENGHHFLAARDTTNSVILGKYLHWNPREYPIMTWCWKANALPPGGDERYSHTNDSAAGIYVFFSQNWLGAPKQLKYVWSTTLPVGKIGRRDLLFRPWFFVVESGEKNLGKWTFEQVDLYANHQLKLGGKPADRTVALLILTDANSTKSYAEANYADLRVWTRDALEKGLIENYCECLETATMDSAPAERQSTDSLFRVEE